MLTPSHPTLPTGHRYALNPPDADKPYTAFGTLIVAAIVNLELTERTIASVFGTDHKTVARVRKRMGELKRPRQMRPIVLYDHGRSARMPDNIKRITTRTPMGSPRVHVSADLVASILGWHVTLGRPLTDACRKHVAPLFTALLPSIYMPTPKTLDEVVAIVERSLRADYAKELAMHKPGTHYEPPPLAPVARPAPTNPEIAEQLADLF